MKKVALTGGIACGKSLVAEILNEEGIPTVDADDIVHELVPEDERRELAKRVFNDPQERRRLEARLHPVVKSRIGRFFDETDAPVAVAIVPLLFEVQWDCDYDIICCVTSTRENQISRMTAKRGYTREHAESRLASQMQVEEKAKKSHYVIRNDTTEADLRAETVKFARWLKEKGQH